MTSLVVYAIMGFTALSISTLAFGASLATTPTFNLIGASDNVTVPAARGNVTSIDFIQEVASDGVVETDGINFSVGNEDAANAHIFEICLVMEGPIGVFNPPVGSIPQCITTLSIAANARLEGQTIVGITAIDISDLLNISISIEEKT